MASLIGRHHSLGQADISLNLLLEMVTRGQVTTLTYYLYYDKVLFMIRIRISDFRTLRLLRLLGLLDSGSLALLGLLGLWDFWDFRFMISEFWDSGSLGLLGLLGLLGFWISKLWDFF